MLPHTSEIKNKNESRRENEKSAKKQGSDQSAPPSWATFWRFLKSFPVPKWHPNLRFVLAKKKMISTNIFLTFWDGFVLFWE